MTDPSARRTHDGLPVTAFAFPGPLRDKLTALVLAGTKQATAGLVADYIVVAIIETTHCDVTTISRVTDEFARAEGEGFADAADWRRAHERFWGSYLEDIRRDLGDPAFSLSDSTPVVCQWIRLVERLDRP